MTRRTKIVAALVVLLALAGAGAAAYLGKAGKGDARKDKEVAPLDFAAADVVRVTPRLMATDLSLPGTVQAVSQATVRSKLSAEVRRIAVREGDRVTAGQVIAEFDTAQLRAQMAERTAALESARAQLAQTERTRLANAALVKQNFISQNAFDTADSAFQAQSASAAAAKAQLEQTQLMLNDAVVRAPISGVVAKRMVQPGEKVGFDAPLLQIVDLAQLEVATQTPVSDVPLVAVGMPATVQIEGLAGRDFKGKVERINPAAETGTRSIVVFVTLANEDSLLKAGMFARVLLRTSAGRELPTLPVSAVRSEGGQAYVWVITDGKLGRRTIGVGRRNERAQLVEVTDGLTPADQVLATRFDNLKDGLAARVLGAAPAAPAVAESAPPAAAPRAAN